MRVHQRSMLAVVVATIADGRVSPLEPPWGPAYWLKRGTEEGDSMSSELSAKFDQVVAGLNLVILAISDIVLFLIANIAYGGGNQHGLRNNVSNVTWAVFLIGFFLLILFGIAYLAQVIRRRAKAHA